MYGIAPIFAHPDFRSWLKAEVTDPPAERPLHPQEQTFLVVKVRS